MRATRCYDSYSIDLTHSTWTLFFACVVVDVKVASVNAKQSGIYVRSLLSQREEIYKYMCPQWWKYVGELM